MVSEHHRKFNRILTHAETHSAGGKEAALLNVSNKLDIGLSTCRKLRDNREFQLSYAPHTEMLDKEYRKLVPQIGGDSEQSLWREVCDALERHVIYADKIDRFLIDTAYYSWSEIALDTTRPDAERLIYGRMSAHVLHSTVFGILKGKNFQHPKPRKEHLIERGYAVSTAVISVLDASPKPPINLFSCDQAYQEAGYEEFKYRMMNDRIAWEGSTARDLEAVASFMLKKLNEGHGLNLMKLHQKYGHFEPAYANTAWNMAIFAGQWDASIAFADKLFASFPEMLDIEVLGIKPIIEDLSVWPGVAAILADKSSISLQIVREKIENEQGFSKLKAVVTPMIPLIQQRASYVKMMKLIRKEK